MNDVRIRRPRKMGDAQVVRVVAREFQWGEL